MKNLWTWLIYVKERLHNWLVDTRRQKLLWTQRSGILFIVFSGDYKDIMYGYYMQLLFKLSCVYNANISLCMSCSTLKPESFLVTYNINYIFFNGKNGIGIACSHHRHKLFKSGPHNVRYLNYFLFYFLTKMIYRSWKIISRLNIIGFELASEIIE